MRGSEYSRARWRSAASLKTGWVPSRYEHEHEVLQDLGNGVVFAVVRMEGSPVGSPGRVQDRWSFTVLWVAGMIERVTARNDIDEARAAAERLAEERR
jgi:hypothetical protein